MNDTETAFTKQVLLVTKDWDTYQAILRNCLAVHPKGISFRGPQMCTPIGGPLGG